MRALLKDAIREIKKSLGRFISIMAIVAIGVAFFAGVSASAPDMKHSADQYFDEYNLMDFRVLSNFGLTQDDINQIKKVEGIKGVYPAHTMDALTQVDGSEIVLKLFGLMLDTDRENNANYINRFRLEEGRFPENANECLMEKGKLLGPDFKLGDTVKLTLGKDNDIHEDLAISEYKIVGFVTTPYYLSYEKGSSTIGSGKVSSFLVIPDQNFKQELYTEVIVTVKEAQSFNSYEDDYFALTDTIKNKLESLGIVQSELRYKDIIQEANESLNEGKVKLDEAKLTFEKEIAEAKAEIESSRYKLLSGEMTLTSQKDTFKIKMDMADEQIKAAEKQLDDGDKQYQEGLIQFEETKKTTDEMLKQAKSGLVELNKQKESYTGLVLQDQLLLTQYNAEMVALKLNPDFDPTSENVIVLQNKIDETTTRISENEGNLSSVNQAILLVEGQIKNIETQLEEGQKKLEDSAIKLKEGRAELNEKKTELAQGKVTAQEEFKKAENKLAQGKVDLEQGRKILLENEKEGKEELDIAQEEIVKGQKEIDAIGEAEWFVLDRKSHYSYMDYGSAGDRMEAIAKVFPLFFFLVAALVCLTTMTRMVDEQRQTIGTLKALGYSKTAIAFKYIFYAIIASVVGSIVGLAIGMFIFPLVIFNAWGIMYSLPTLHFKFQPGIMLIATLSAVLITTFAAMAACYKELIETPSLLMRPKAPKNGKKIFLEKIHFLWNRFSFSEKVTARNIFRYKKRFFMTVIGISGCTALLLAGFGIQDSIGELVSKQFDELTLYDASVSLDKKITPGEFETFVSELSTDERINDSMKISQTAVTATHEGKEEEIVLIVPSDVEKFKDYTHLRTRIQHKNIPLGNEGVILTEKLAKNLSVSIGDSIQMDGGYDYKETVKVIGITENYIAHYAFMSPSTYKNLYEVRPSLNTLILKLTDSGVQQEEQLGMKLMEHESVVSTAFYTSIKDNFSGMISSLGIIVVVLVISAGLLAFVVLYNLTNVNISERLREIATIKVLGFYDKEVSSYVFRENIVLGFIGALCGLALGAILHQFIMTVAELDSVMFGRNINLLSYLYSLAITMLFTQIVNWVMHRKLQRIKMVESLKSVE